MIQEDYSDRYYRVSAHVSLDNVCANMINTRKLVADSAKIMAVIKADGYGHGAVPLAKAFDEIKMPDGRCVVDAYGVAIAEEGIELREAGISKPVLILGMTDPSEYDDIVKYDITAAVCSIDAAMKLNSAAIRQNKKAKIHIKLDTGMGRIGYAGTDADADEVAAINKLGNIDVEGMFTHFSKADEEDKSYTLTQFKRYMDFNDKLVKRGVNIRIKHVANSAGITEFPEMALDMVRSGISTYGLYPSDFVTKSKLPLQPGMELKSHISFIKNVDAGFTVGYGASYVTVRPTTIATVPVGYADGYFRSLSNKGFILLHGKKVPIVGRICMDQFMVDATGIENLKIGDEVTLFGHDGGEFLSVEEISELAGSFNYEFICAISKRVPRIYYRNGKPVYVRRFV